MLFTGLGRSVLGETVPEVRVTPEDCTQTAGTVSPAREQHYIYCACTMKTEICSYAHYK